MHIKTARRTNRQAVLLRLHHRGVAIHAKDVNLFGGSHAVAAAGADIFAGVARLRRWCGSGGVSVSRAARRAAPFNPVHRNIRPALFNDEIAKGLGRLRDTPPDARVVADGQVACGGCIPEFFIVVRPAPAAILNAVLQIPEVYHFMQQRRRRVFDRPVECSRSDVQLMAVFLPLAPRLANCHMAVCAGRALDGDDGFFQLPIEVFGIQRPEHLFKVASGSGSLDSLFHVVALTFKIQI